MSGVDDLLSAIDDPQGITPGVAADDALLALLVHVAFSDGVLDDEELNFLARVLPGRDEDELRSWVRRVADDPLDAEALLEALPGIDDRWKALRFGVRMAWKDGTIADEETDLLSGLADALGLPDNAFETVLDEMKTKTSPVVEPARLVEVLQAVKWDAVELEDGPVTGALAGEVPDGATAVAHVRLDGVEVFGFYREGIVAHFRQGIAWLSWADMVTFTRLGALGGSVELHTEDGRSWTLIDSRLSGVGLILDRIFVNPKNPESKPPVVEQLRGG